MLVPATTLFMILIEQHKTTSNNQFSFYLSIPIIVLTAINDGRCVSDLAKRMAASIAFKSVSPLATSNTIYHTQSLKKEQELSNINTAYLAIHTNENVLEHLQ